MTAILREILMYYSACAVACAIGLCLLAIKGETDWRNEWWYPFAWPYLCFIGWREFYRNFIKGRQ